MTTKDQVAQLIVGEAKACAKCGLSKPLCDFNKNCAAKDGKRSECRTCQSTYSRSYHAANFDARCAAARIRYANNPDPIKAKNLAYQSANRQAITAKNRARRRNDPAKASAAHLRIRYGLDVVEYNQMLERQSGMCANPGCSNEPPANRRLDVDHDHACCPGGTSCGECVRGLLCRSCNQALGFIRDDIARLRGLADYLERAGKF